VAPKEKMKRTILPEYKEGFSHVEAEVERTKPHVNIGTIGHVDHGRRR